MSDRDTDLAAYMRDWRLTACNHTEMRADEALICCSPCLRDRLLASDWLAAHDTALREQIAQAIEALPLGEGIEIRKQMVWGEHGGDEIRARAANIARTTEPTP